jgi:hypothetical protein
MRILLCRKHPAPMVYTCSMRRKVRVGSCPKSRSRGRHAEIRYSFSVPHAPSANKADSEFVFACAGNDAKEVLALNHLRFEEMTTRPIFDLDDPDIGIETDFACEARLDLILGHRFDAEAAAECTISWIGIV